jgi:phosphinothricin acetyltransferase
VDVSVYVGEAFRRRGIGSALYTALFPLPRLQGFFAAHAGITLPNAGSVGLHESLGFVPVGVYRGVGYEAALPAGAGTG